MKINELRPVLFAPWWELWLARLLGKRHDAHDDIGHMVWYRWRGRLYLTYSDSSMKVKP
jgi:hypothetical protein